MPFVRVPVAIFVAIAAFLSASTAEPNRHHREQNEGSSGEQPLELIARISKWHHWLSS